MDESRRHAAARSTPPRHLWTSTTLVMLLCALAVTPSAAQPPTWSIAQSWPFGVPGEPGVTSATMSASGRYVALLRHELRVYDVVTDTWDEVPFAQLVAFNPPLPASLWSPAGLELSLFLVGISDDGRYVAYGGRTSGVVPFILARYDRATGVIDEVQRNVFVSIKGKFTTHFVMSRDGSTIAWVLPGVAPDADSLHTWRSGVLLPVPHTCVVSPALSADGARVAYRECGTDTQRPVGVSILSFALGSVVNFREVGPLARDGLLAASGDLQFVALSSPEGPYGVFDTGTRVLDTLAVAGPRLMPLAATARATSAVIWMVPRPRVRNSRVC